MVKKTKGQKTYPKCKYIKHKPNKRKETYNSVCM